MIFPTISFLLCLDRLVCLVCLVNLVCLCSLLLKILSVFILNILSLHLKSFPSYIHLGLVLQGFARLISEQGKFNISC